MCQCKYEIQRVTNGKLQELGSEDDGVGDQQGNQGQRSQEVSIGEIVQKLVDHGHSWSSIQNYSLSEIGLFLKVIVKKEFAAKAERLSEFWLAHNLQYKGLKEILKELEEKRNPPTKEQKQAEIQSNWARLASLSQR